MRRLHYTIGYFCIYVPYLAFVFTPWHKHHAVLGFVVWLTLTLAWTGLYHLLRNYWKATPNGNDH